eukprot:gene4636-27787_t
MLPDEKRSGMAAQYAETYGERDASRDHGRQTVTRDEEPRYGAAAPTETSNGNQRATPRPRASAFVSGVGRGGGARGGGASRGGGAGGGRANARAVWGKRHHGGSSASSSAFSA